MKGFLTGLLFALAAGTSLLTAQDKITYEDGKEEMGKVIRQDTNEIILRVKGVEKTIPKNEIVKIQLDYIKDKHFLEAKELLETSVKRFQDTDANKFLLIKAAFKVKDYATAEKTIASGKGIEYQLMRAYLVLKKNGGAEALKLIKSVPENKLLSSELIDREILSGFANADIKNFDEAVRVLKKIEAKYPGDVQNQFTLLALNRDLPSFLQEIARVQKELTAAKDPKAQANAWELLKPNLAQFYRDTEDKKLIDLERAKPAILVGGGMTPEKKFFSIVSISSFGGSAFLGIVSGLFVYQTVIARETYINAKTDIDARYTDWQNAQTGTLASAISASGLALAGMATGIISLILPDSSGSAFQFTPTLSPENVGLRISYAF